MTTDKRISAKSFAGRCRTGKHRRLRWLLALIAAAALAAAAALFAWTKGAFLPSWIVWEEKTLDPGGEADAPSVITLNRRRLTIQKDGEIIWQSPKDILIQDFLWCDINHDKTKELILLCWRMGRYGNARPFWVEHDEKTWSQHIYIYQCHNDNIQPLWMASDIGMDVAAFEFNETDRLCITETNQRQTRWDFVSWGLTLIEEKKSESKKEPESK